MSDELRVILELGKGGRRIVAGATDWPGLDRWGKTEEAAIDRLLEYVPRYAPVADRAGLADELAAQNRPTVIERMPGNGSTDFWGIAHVPSMTEQDVLSEAELDRRLALLEACWAYFDDVAARVSAELRLGPRGGGRTREQITRHVLLNEPGQFSSKVEVRTPIEVVSTPDGLATHRHATVDAIRAFSRDGRRARRWPIQFLVRRIAQHVMDHAWEMEDKDLTPAG